MIGNRYWYTGVQITPYGEVYWGIQLDFLDDGFAEDFSTEGTFRVRYNVQTPALAKNIKVLIADAGKIGIRLHAGLETPTVYVKGDGADKDVLYPANWREVRDDLCRELGWDIVARWKDIPPAALVADNPKHAADFPHPEHLS